MSYNKHMWKKLWKMETTDICGKEICKRDHAFLYDIKSS